MANLPQSGNYNNQIFTSNLDIDNFFKNFGSPGFVEWFNTNISSNSVWNKTLINKLKWEYVWANLGSLFGRSSINLIEFLCINSIIINETGGKFIPLSEKSGSQGNPGISYAFNGGSKLSYNTLNTNNTAYQNFNDPIYIKVHGHKPLGSVLKNTTDARWSGNLFPLGFSGMSVGDETSSSGKTNGFLTEADFFKFRGRGYIQSTGRANYKPLITYILNYTGNDPIILQTQTTWSSYSGNLDSIASSSTNDLWDNLFQNTNSIIANYGVYIHSTLPSKYKNYNTIDPNQSDVNLNNSIMRVAYAIAGGNATQYANTFLQRILVQLNLINSYTNGSIPAPPFAANTTPSSPPTQGRLASTGQDPNSNVGSNTTGTVYGITNILQPTNKPTAISFTVG
jgi:hypothetical protein